jgi:hypothetical protein
MAEPRTWVLTGSPENFAATREHGFEVIGLKERRLGYARQIERGDRIVLYVTRVKAFGASVRVAGELFEERAPAWPGKPGKADAYPWRFATRPEVVLEEDDWVCAEDLAGRLEHVSKWPRENWTLAFQGQIRAVSDHDARMLMEAMGAAARAHA